MRVKGKEYEVTQQLLDQNILCITCLSHFIVCVYMYYVNWHVLLFLYYVNVSMCVCVYVCACAMCVYVCACVLLNTYKRACWS